MLTEAERSKAQEKSTAYLHMTQTWAWRDFEKNILDTIRQDALESFMTNSDSPEKLRGMVKAIDLIKSQVGYILEGEQ